MLTGRRPFEGDNDAAVVHAITNSTPEPVARFKSGVTGELQQIINKALAKDPSLRYQHADGMLADLKRLAPESGATKTRRIGLVVVATTFIIIVAGYFSYSTFHRGIDKTPGQKRLVILPFENMGDSDKDYFVSGITEEITSRFANIKGLAVVPRGTANRYGNSEKTMSQIGQELNADYIIDGTMRWQKSADGEERVRVSVYLIDVNQDASIWSRTYDTVVNEVFSIQSDMAENATEQMGIKLNVVEKKKIWERYTTSQQAYDFYLQGKKFHSLHGGFGPLRDFQLAAEMHEKAIALDSNFAEAFSALSIDYSMQWGRGNHIDSIKERALKTALKGLELKPDSKFGGLVLARYYYHCENDPQKALEVLTETYKDDLTADDYLNQSQIFLRRMGRWEEAYRRKQVQLDEHPKSIYSVYDQGQNCMYLRKYKEAEQLFDKVIEMQPDFYGAYSYKVELYINWMGNIEKARDVIRESYGKVDSSNWRSDLSRFDLWEGNSESAMADLSMPPLDSLTYYLNVGLIHCTMKQPEIMRIYFDSALVYARAYLEKNPDIPRAHIRMGLIYAGLGHKDEAITEGQEAMKLAPLERDAFSNWQYLEYMLRIYIILDEKDKALGMLEHMLTSDNYFGLPRVFIDPDYSPMLDYPGFDRIVEKHGNEYANALWQSYRDQSI
jgi:TolB-like protein